jgi:hypothetical protein
VCDWRPRFCWYTDFSPGFRTLSAFRNTVISYKELKKTNMFIRFGLVLWCLMPLSTIFQLYRGVNWN